MTLLLSVVACTPAPHAATNQTWFVDAVRGDDSNSGADETHAWRTLAHVSSAALGPGDTVRFRRGQVFRGTLALGENQYAHSNGSENGLLVVSTWGEGAKPIFLASERLDQPADWVDEGGDVWRSARTFPHDVGNVLFLSADEVDHVGVKKWSRAELGAPGDFWFDLDTKRSTKAASVYLRSKGNPSRSVVELALNVPNIYVEHGEFIALEDLDLRYAGSMGIAVTDSHHVTVRRCDIAWVGGANNFETAAAGTAPVRYGNGVQFYADIHDVLVEGCRIHDVYDTALTNQFAGTRSVSQHDIAYRFNTVWNVGMAALEVWADTGSTVQRVQFLHNTCVGAGRGWGAEQRPDPVGVQLAWWYGRKGTTSEVDVRNNLFADAAGGAVMVGDAKWASVVRSDFNGYATSTSPMGVLFDHGGRQDLRGLAELQGATGWDAHSLEGDPQFRDPSHADFRLAATSVFRGRAQSLGLTVDGRGVPLSTAASLGAEQD